MLFNLKCIAVPRAKFAYFGTAINVAISIALLTIIPILNCTWHSRQVSAWSSGFIGLLRLASSSASKNHESWIMNLEYSLGSVLYQRSTVRSTEILEVNTSMIFFSLLEFEVWSLKHTHDYVYGFYHTKHTHNGQNIALTTRRNKKKNKKTFSVALRTTFSF